MIMDNLTIRLNKPGKNVLLFSVHMALAAGVLFRLHKHARSKHSQACKAGLVTFAALGSHATGVHMQ